MWFWACPTHAGACFVVCGRLTLLPLVAATGRRGAVIYTAALCLIGSALRQRSCGKAAVRRLHQRCPQAAPPFLLRTKSCLSPSLGGSSVGFTPHRRPWGHVTAGAYCHRIPQLRRPEPWCVLPRRPEELRCVALRCQADEHTAPSRPTAPRFAPSRFTASTAGALLRGGCSACVWRPAAGGGRQALVGRATSAAAGWVAGRPAAFGWGASPLGWAATQRVHLWGLVGVPPRLLRALKGERMPQVGEQVT